MSNKRVTISCYKKDLDETIQSINDANEWFTKLGIHNYEIEVIDTGDIIKITK